MTRTKKLFVAAAILAAGYGVASLLGEPATMLLSQNAPPVKLAIAQTSSASAVSAPVEHAPDELRLVPDARPIETPTPEATLRRPERAPHTLSNDWPLAEVAAAPASPTSEPAWYSAFDMNASAGPHATLRNEAPRPMFPEPQSGAAVFAAPPIAEVNSNSPIAESLAREAMTTVPNPVVPADYAGVPANREAGRMGVATISPSPRVEQTGISNPFVAPPPFPPVEEEESRTHIIVDGDSLAKLANRYLNDPQRGDEIYEQNRHVLSDPELLPIGAELVIPPRNRMQLDGTMPQSALPGALAVHSAARGELVPVRPVPSSAVMVPRAQLSRPLPAP